LQEIQWNPQWGATIKQRERGRLETFFVMLDRYEQKIPVDLTSQGFFSFLQPNACTNFYWKPVDLRWPKLLQSWNFSTVLILGGFDLPAGSSDWGRSFYIQCSLDRATGWHLTSFQNWSQKPDRNPPKTFAGCLNKTRPNSSFSDLLQMMNFLLSDAILCDSRWKDLSIEPKIKPNAFLKPFNELIKRTAQTLTGCLRWQLGLQWQLQIWTCVYSEWPSLIFYAFGSDQILLCYDHFLEALRLLGLS
jgi:hypothetical protein